MGVVAPGKKSTYTNNCGLLNEV